MKYKCIPCNHEFETKADKKPRCPRCLNIHDVELVTETGENADRSKRSLAVPLGVLLTAGIVAAAYVAVRDTGDGDAPAAAASESIFEALDVAEKEAVRPCEPTEAVRELADALAPDQRGEAALDALFKGLSGLRDAGKWIPYHQREPKESRPLTADMAAAALRGDDGEPWRATSYELACLLAATARSRGVDAAIVEVLSYQGEKRPADPAGKLGRFAVALKAASDETTARPVYDVYSNRAKEAAVAEIVRLDAGTEMAPYFGISALSHLVRQETTKALELNDIAIKLDPQSPYYRAGRGFIFAATGVPSEALVEFEKALKQRTDAVNRVNLAEILMLVNPLDRRAEAEIQAALEAMPDYAKAHALKAMIHLVRQEKDQAETELTLADRLDPKSPTIAMYWARYHAVTMNSDDAVRKAKQAVALSGDSVSMLLGLAGVYREVAQFDEMRATLDKILARVDTPQMQEQIKQIFGYDPDDGDAEEETLADEGAPPRREDIPGNFELKLGDELGGSKPGLGDRLDLNLDIK